MTPCKTLHGRLPWVAYALSLENRKDCLEQYLDVQPEAHVINVPDVQRELLLPGDDIAAIHLRPARYPGPDFMTTHLLRCIELKIFHQQRSWTDQAHVPFEDIDKFGKFVQAGAAQKPAEIGQAVCVMKGLALRISFVAHRAELQDREWPAAASGSLLGE